MMPCPPADFRRSPRVSRKRPGGERTWPRRWIRRSARWMRSSPLWTASRPSTSRRRCARPCRFFAHPEFHIIDDVRLIERDQYRLQTLVLPEHVGPHVDAPAHVVAERAEATVDTLDVTALWGRAVVVDVSDRDWKAGDLLDVDDLMGAAADGGARIREGDVVLVNFGWSRHLRDGGPGVTWWSSNAPGFTEDLCRELHD